MSHTPAPDASLRRPLCLVHASDLHLDRPPHGMVDDPDHLRDRLVDCPYQAAQNVVETALAEAADALILAGNVVDLDLAGPRAMVFLREQFARLAEKKIPVFWAGGTTDPPGAWPPSSPLPDNVHTFPIGRIEAHTIHRDGKTVARVVGTSLGRDESVPLERFRRDADALLTVGVACIDLPRDAAEQSRVDYLALGGRTDRKTATFGRQAAHYPGTPQGRSPLEIGPRGCTLVEIDHEGHISIKAIPTDTLRFHTESVDVTGSTTLSSLESALCDRVRTLSAKAGERDLVVTWRLSGEARQLDGLRRGGAEGVVSRLRERFGHKSPAVWSVELIIEPNSVLPAAWYEQQTILGDVLRRIRELEQQTAAPIDLNAYLTESDRQTQLASLADLSDNDLRLHVLREASTLAADLLAVSNRREESKLAT